MKNDGYHKCEWCDVIYYCACATTHNRKRRPPDYDCGKCRHRPEIVDTFALTSTVNAVRDYTPKAFEFALLHRMRAKAKRS